jgi:hypothetical protein
LKHVRFKLGIRKHRGCILDLRVQLGKIITPQFSRMYD